MLGCELTGECQAAFSCSRVEIRLLTRGFSGLLGRLAVLQRLPILRRLAVPSGLPVLRRLAVACGLVSRERRTEGQSRALRGQEELG
jgi:hypothetical protein